MERNLPTGRGKRKGWHRHALDKAIREAWDQLDPQDKAKRHRVHLFVEGDNPIREYIVQLAPDQTGG